MVTVCACCLSSGRHQAQPGRRSCANPLFPAARGDFGLHPRLKGPALCGRTRLPEELHGAEEQEAGSALCGRGSASPLPELEELLCEEELASALCGRGHIVLPDELHLDEDELKGALCGRSLVELLPEEDLCTDGLRKETCSNGNDVAVELGDSINAPLQHS